MINQGRMVDNAHYVNQPERPDWPVSACGSEGGPYPGGCGPGVPVVNLASETPAIFLALARIP